MAHTGQFQGQRANGEGEAETADSRGRGAPSLSQTIAGGALDEVVREAFNLRFAEFLAPIV